MSETQLAVDANEAAKMLGTCQAKFDRATMFQLPVTSEVFRLPPVVAAVGSRLCRRARSVAQNGLTLHCMASSIYQRRREKTWCTYFVRGASLIKIGRTKDWQQRMKALRVTCPIPLHCIGLILEDREKELHVRFAHLRVRDEWFKAAKELLDFIKSTDE